MCSGSADRLRFAPIFVLLHALCVGSHVRHRVEPVCWLQRWRGEAGSECALSAESARLAIASISKAEEERVRRGRASRQAAAGSDDDDDDDDDSDDESDGDGFGSNPIRDMLSYRTR